MLRLQYEKEEEAGHVTVQSKFNYAWGLVKSPRYVDQVQGVKLLQGELPSPIFLVHVLVRLSLPHLNVGTVWRVMAD